MVVLIGRWSLVVIVSRGWLSYDGDRGTSWPTDRYNDRTNTFGGLKDGIGIAFDFGQPTTLREVTVATDRPGTSIRILAGDTLDQDPEQYAEVGAKADTAATNRIPVKAGATASRYFIVWIYELTEDGAGRYYGSLSEVSFQR